MIPDEKKIAVARGLEEAFGQTEFEDIERITKGNNTTRVFRIVVRGTPYLLKIILRTDDASRHYSCMRAAADAGLAPRVWYTNVEDRVAITDFVETAPLPVEDALVRLPAVLRRLHALPAFPGIPNAFNTSCLFLLNPDPALDGFLEKFRAAGVFPKPEIDELYARHRELAAVYPHHEPDMVSSHNDLFKPDNILFDGSRVLLVDWECAFRNDRYADLAVVAHQVVASDAEEQIYLQEYFGAPPDAYQSARFFLMRQVSHIFYAMAFLFVGGGQPVDWTVPVPEFRELQRRIWAGEADLKDPSTKTAYARVHWEQLVANAERPRYCEALGIVSERHAAS